jgi:hypothetical protein
MPVNACANAPDNAALMKHPNITNDIKICSVESSGNPSAATACLQNRDGLSEPCALCYSLQAQCTVAQCSMCIDNPMDSHCLSCVQTQCGAPWVVCTGFYDAGTD